jgi:hypothetical protein
MITKKLASTHSGKRNRNKGKGQPNGMTEEEMIAEQKRLFDNANNYMPSDQENDQDNYQNHIAENGDEQY